MTGAELVRQEGRADVGFRELAREECERVAGGASAGSTLVTGW